MLHSERMKKEKMTDSLAFWQCYDARHCSGPAKPVFANQCKITATRSIYLLIAQLIALVCWKLQYDKQQNAHRCLPPGGNKGRRYTR